MLELTNVQHDLFVLLRHSLGKEHDSLSDSFDWEAVFTEAKNQSVQLLVSTAAAELTEEKAISEAAYKKSLSLYNTNLNTSYSIEMLDKMMKDNGIPYMILKGGASAFWYPEPMNRMLGDVDFLISDEHKAQVGALIEENGYREKSKFVSDHHVEYIGDGAELEMHFDIPGVPVGELGEIVHEYMSDALTKAVDVNLADINVMLPEAKYHGLIIILHMQHHMLGEGLGLRHLMVLALFADRTYEESFWENELLPLLKRIGMFRFTQVMIKTGSLYFGTVCPSWAEEVEDELCDDVMNDILTGGNFGRKNKERSRSGWMIRRRGNGVSRHVRIKTLYINLHNATLSHWPWVEKHKIIWFFADCYRGILFAYRMITGRRPSLIKAGQYVEERRSVYERLGVFEV